MSANRCTAKLVLSKHPRVERECGQPLPCDLHSAALPLRRRPEVTDPDALLERIRRLAANAEPELADAVRALDSWLSRGGVPPEAWQQDLKAILMVVGNLLVLSDGYEPASMNFPVTGRSTQALAILSEWLNHNPEARERLAAAGLRWRMR